MKLTWLGHACFLLEQDGFRIVIDPYTDVEGYPPLQAEAHEVYCSHQHFDHCAEDCVTYLPPCGSPFTVRRFHSFHDDQGGALRGKNTIHVFSAGGVTVAHLGDLGHLLTAPIGPVDGVLVPTGGVYTIDPVQAKAVCDLLQPRFIIPMHYRRPPFGFPVLADVEEFLALYPQVQRLDSPTLEITADTAGVILPACPV